MRKLYKDEEMIREFGRMVRTRRSIYRLSQREIAQMTNMPPSTISLIEQGRTEISFTMMIRVLEALGLELRIRPKN